jgi:hypothetical protein
MLDDEMIADADHKHNGLQLMQDIDFFLQTIDDSFLGTVLHVYGYSNGPFGRWREA